jgi:GT2 family glycosyltransferase
MPLISVVIPTFNRREKVVKAIDSVLLQSYQEIEILVIDDESHDESLAFLTQRYKCNNKVQIISQKHQGVSNARNLGIAKAKGEWIAFLDSDDLWKADKLALQIHHLNKYPQYKFGYHNEIWLRNDIRVNPVSRYCKLGGDIFNASLSTCIIATSTVIIHKSIFLEIGNFDGSLPACEDYDLWLRILAKHPVLFLDEYLTIRNAGHADQLSMQYVAMDRFRIQSLKNLLANIHVSSLQRQSITEILKHKVQILFKGAKKHQNSDLLELLSNQYSNYL